MAKLAKLLSFVRAVRNGIPVSDVKCDPGGGANVTAEHACTPGDDSHPLPGDYVAIGAASGTGRETAVGYYDPLNAGKAQAGEKRIYARSEDGAVSVEVWLKNTGECFISNGSGTFILEPGGTFDINGFRITPDGNGTTAKGVSLDGHTHDQAADSAGNSQSTTNKPNAG